MKHTKDTCKLINYKILSKERQRNGEHLMMPCKFCKTHNVVVCRCGYPFSEHPWFRDKDNELVKDNIEWGEEIEDIEVLIS